MDKIKNNSTLILILVIIALIISMVNVTLKLNQEKNKLTTYELAQMVIDTSDPVESEMYTGKEKGYIETEAPAVFKISSSKGTFYISYHTMTGIIGCAERILTEGE